MEWSGHVADGRCNHQGTSIRYYQIAMRFCPKTNEKGNKSRQEWREPIRRCLPTLLLPVWADWYFRFFSFDHPLLRICVSVYVSVNRCIREFENARWGERNVPPRPSPRPVAHITTHKKKLDR